MTIKAYLDTNVYVYVALKNINYFEKCKSILNDALTGKIFAYGSLLVAVELLGSISRINPQIAQEALKAYLSMPIHNLEITYETLQLSALVNTVVNIGYDSIHAATMIINGVDKIITNDIDDWRKFKENYREVKKIASKHGFRIKAKEFQAIPIDSYMNSTF